MTRSYNTSIMRDTKGNVKMDKFDRLLMQVGMPAHVKGYRYTKAALKLLEGEPERIDCITREVYTPVAVELNSTWGNVERSIRRGVELAFDRMPPALQVELFGNSVMAEKGKAANKEFLAAMLLHLEEGAA